MAYRCEQNCADRVRLARAENDLGLTGGELIRELIHSFFAAEGVKNLKKRARSSSKFSHTSKV